MAGKGEDDLMRTFKIVLKDDSDDVELRAEQFNETEHFACFSTFDAEGNQETCLRVALSEIFAIREFK